MTNRIAIVIVIALAALALLFDKPQPKTFVIKKDKVISNYQAGDVIIVTDMTHEECDHAGGKYIVNRHKTQTLCVGIDS